MMISLAEADRSLIGPLIRMQARGFLPQQVYPREQLETVEQNPSNFGRLVDREVARLFP
jgi:hypothetical protein